MQLLLSHVGSNQQQLLLLCCCTGCRARLVAAAVEAAVKPIHSADIIVVPTAADCCRLQLNGYAPCQYALDDCYTQQLRKSAVVRKQTAQC
jgi:hypothetical protein